MLGVFLLLLFAHCCLISLPAIALSLKDVFFLPRLLGSPNACSLLIHPYLI